MTKTQKGNEMNEVQSLEQAIEIVEKYVKESYVDPSEEIEKVIEEIEKHFEVDSKKLDRIVKILEKSKLKNTKKEIEIDEADKLLLQGFLKKIGIRETKKFKELVDFDNDKIDFEFLLNTLKRKHRDIQKQSQKES